MKTAREWLRYATARLGPLPANVVAFDVETTGLDMRHDLVAQVGWAIFAGSEMVDNGSVMLDWVSGANPGQVAWLADRIRRTKEHIEYRHGYATGSVYPISVERMRERGINPVTALCEFRRLLESCRSDGYAFVAHNGLRCDVPILDRHFTRDCGLSPFAFKPAEYRDTAALEKAVQTLPQIKPGEDWLSFSKRAYYLGGNQVLSSLERHCVPKYGLIEKHALDVSRAHEADFDALATGYLYQAFHTLAAI